MLEIKNLIKSYRRGIGKRALDTVSLSFAPGDIVGLFGENGAGKTTLFKCILKYFEFGGTIQLDGEPITHSNIARIAYGSSNNTFFPRLSLQDHRDFYEMHFPGFRASRFALLTDFFELSPKKPLKDFSQGQKNQAETILALSQGAEYILLDEPFANNDIFNREAFYKLLLGLLQPTECLILSSHLIEELRNFPSRVVLLHKGKVLADQAMEELDREDHDLLSWMKKMYGYEDRAAQFIARAEREEGVL